MTRGLDELGIVGEVLAELGTLGVGIEEPFPAEDLRQLQVLAGHLREGQFLTKFRKTFARDEMDDDLLLVPAKLGKAEDWSEYEEILPTSPP